MKNEKILSAISKHTLAGPDMSKMDKVIYVSDKIANDRKERSNFVLRRLAYKNFDETFVKALKQSVKYLEKKGVQPHDLTLEAVQKFAYGNKYGPTPSKVGK